MQELEDLRKIGRLVEETVEAPRLVNGAAGGDWRRMRGLPIVARGVRGAAPGTDPVGELLRKENGRHR